MKYLRLFEQIEIIKKNDLTNWEIPSKKSWFEIDKKLTITRIESNVDKGKVKFRIGQDHPRKYTAVAGVALILGKKYENNTIIREIELKKETTVRQNTKMAVLRHFLKKAGYEEPELSHRLDVVSKDFSLNSLILESKNLGELIDKMKEFRDYFLIEQDRLYDIWKLQKDAIKYNL